MTQPRIPPRAQPYEAAVADLFATLPPGLEPLRLFRTVAHNPRVLQRLFRGALLDRGSVELAERELVILRTCARCFCEYEWGVHVALFGAKAGFTDAQIAATVQGAADDSAWSPAQTLLLRLADALHDSASIDDRLWSALAARWSPAQLIELMMLAGLYHAVSFVANGSRVAPEPYAARFPGPVSNPG